MPETPKKVRDAVDVAIQELNANWDLQLLHLHGSDAKAAETTSALAKRCSAHLRYLSFRLPSLEIPIKDFDDRARQLWSKWTFKPTQERGTLPTLPASKSALQRDVKRMRVLGLNKLNKSQRDQLIIVLNSILEPLYDEAMKADSRRRLSSQPARRSELPWDLRDSPSSNTPNQHRDSHEISAVCGPIEIPKIKKREASTVANNESKRKKSDDYKQAKIGKFFNTSSEKPGLKPPPVNKSFETNASTPPSQVFDTPDLASCSSGATSASPIEESQNYFPTQEAADLLDDVALQRSLDASLPTTITSSFSSEDIPQKLEATFSGLQAFLPPKLPFEYRYELQSVALAWNESPLEVYREVRKTCKTEVPEPDKRFQAMRQLRKRDNKDPIETFGIRAWSPNQDKHQSTYLTGSLKWSNRASDPTLLKLTLNSPESDKSARLHRIFGGDRFLTLQLPFLHRSELPAHLRDHTAKLYESVVSWLATCEHNIAGRQWRAFWVDDKPPKATKDKPSFNRIHMFAVSGVGLDAVSPNHRPDHRPMSIEEFIDVYAPMAHNFDSTDLKLFARFKLGLSKTIPTVVLRKENFRFAPDIIGDDGKSIMNDGCALMSSGLAREIAYMLGLNFMPTAFQGRISGLKGLWVVDYRNVMACELGEHLLQYTESQLKVKPGPDKRDACDEYRTFEVSDYSRPPSQPAVLNTQFITVLTDRGVPRKVLEERLRDQLHQYYYNDLCSAMANPPFLRDWIQKYHRPPRQNETVDMVGAFPSDRSEKMNMLLDAGFTPQDGASPIVELLSQTINSHLTRYAEKLKISVPESTNLYCVPDPYGVLEEGEVHCGLSKGWTNPRTSAISLCVAGVDALVARNPANLPSDVQRIKTVFKIELQEFQDVMVFSTKGQQSLASLLSGGDYDGDQCWMCWDPELVTNFKNWPTGPPGHIDPKVCRLTKKSVKLKTMFSTWNATSANSFLISCIGFNLKQPMVGICTSEHEKVVYHQNLQSDGAILLAALVSFLVDSRKQGLELSEEDWPKIRVQCRGDRELSKPAWKEPGRMTKWKDTNIIDHLRFHVAQAAVEKVLQHFSQNWPRELIYMQKLTTIWKMAVDRARNRKNGSAIGTLKKLRQDIQKVFEEWMKLGGKEDDPAAHPRRVAQCFEHLLAIKPLVDRSREQDDIHRRYEDEEGQQWSYWSLLRASCFYNEYPKKMLTWYMVGAELCYLMAQRSEGSRSMTAKMYAITKLDSRTVRSRVPVLEESFVDEVGFTR